MKIEGGATYINTCIAYLSGQHVNTDLYSAKDLAPIFYSSM